MPKYYDDAFVRTLRNDIPIDTVIVDFLKMEVRSTRPLLRFSCPVCHNFHTATNHDTNLARCFDCRKNFNPIDMVISMGKCSFLDAVKFLKDRIE